MNFHGGYLTKHLMLFENSELSTAWLHRGAILKSNVKKTAKNVVYCLNYRTCDHHSPEEDLVELGFRLGEKRAVLDWIAKHHSGAADTPTSLPSSPAADASPAPSTPTSGVTAVFRTPTSACSLALCSFEV